MDEDSLLYFKREKMKSTIFSTPVVQALLAGRKMQFRKVITDQVTLSLFKTKFEMEKTQVLDPKIVDIVIDAFSPYKKDSVLFVKETFKVVQGGSFAVFKAGGNNIDDDSEEARKETKWSPSVHLSKEYARFFLKITNIKVQRLKGLSRYDCMAEGIDYRDLGHSDPTSDGNEPFIYFQRLWDSSAKQAHRWKENPMVFVYDFEIVKKDEV